MVSALVAVVVCYVAWHTWRQKRRLQEEAAAQRAAAQKRAAARRPNARDIELCDSYTPPKDLPHGTQTQQRTREVRKKRQIRSLWCMSTQASETAALKHTADLT